ncbi:hypothetical protein WDU94_012317, partial [Cyamophila willieti]
MMSVPERIACGAVKQSLRTFFIDCSSRHFRFGSSKLIVACGAFKGFVDTLKNCFFQTFPNSTLKKWPAALSKNSQVLVLIVFLDN